MSATSQADRPDPEELERSLKALSFSNRLEILFQLQEQRAVDEIQLTPAGEEGEDRPLSRQAVRHHLAQLEDAGLIRSEMGSSEMGRQQRSYVIDEGGVYQVLESLRSLVARGSEPPLEPARTERFAPATGDEGSDAWTAAPRLVLVHGAPDTRVFPLRERDTEPPRGWVLGRSPDVQVPLPYDPFLSAENTEVLRTEDGSFSIIHLRSATNRTRLNDELLDPGEERALEHGDVIQVGSSRLVFHHPS